MITTLEAYHVNLKDVKASEKWFEALQLGFEKQAMKPAAMLKEGGGQLVSTIVPGNLYAFLYAPIGAKELPYYDTFPLVFPFARGKETFHGLNMHYLPYPTRFALFRELLRISGSNTMSNNQKMQFSWEMIVGISKLAPLQACVKQYRFDAVKSPFMKIKSTDWPTAMILPTHQFKKADVKTVWADSKKMRNW